jgi:N-acetylmuramoyl-L-alanine amidase
LLATTQSITNNQAFAQLNGNAVENDNGTDSTSAVGTVDNKHMVGFSDAIPIRVVYPTPAKIEASKSFIVGCCRPGDSLTCNGEPVKLTKDGYFAHVVPLKPGDNKFTLVETGMTSASREVHAIRSSEPPAIPPDQLTIIKESFHPQQDMAFTPGDLVHFSVRATPGAEVYVTMGHKTIRLRTLEKTASAHAGNKKSKAGATKHVASGKPISVNGGMGVAYGKTFQQGSHGRDDTYYGFYKIAADDDWRNIHPRVNAAIGGKMATMTGSGAFQVLHQPLLAETAHDNTIVRLGPGAGRTTPLVKGIRLMVDGWQGDQVRCLYAANKHFWIAKNELEWENNDDGSIIGDKKLSGVEGPAPGAMARTINIADDEFGSYISVPLTQRLPYQVVQSTKPNSLVLKLYGVTADTDWVSDPHLNANQSDDDKTSTKHKLIDTVTWNQPVDGQYDVTVTLKGHRQWGFKVDYEGSELKLHIRRAPHIDTSNASKSLSGLKICLDPGHGGKEVGAFGPSGVTESNVNLGIALRLKDLLEKSGAQVIMTRTTDKDVSLEDRVRIANENKVQILLSVHNNSLPDGRDPWLEHGTSSYYYHPQSTELSQYLNNALASTVNLSSIGNRFQNLALARPSAMPAVLAEVGFMINPEEYALLISPEGQDLAAQGLFKGLHDYLRGSDHKSADHKL